MRGIVPILLALGLALAPGCSSQSEPVPPRDSEVRMDLGIADAQVPAPDAGSDVGVELGPIDHGPRDLGPDDLGPPDSALDAGPCEVPCIANDPCRPSVCNTDTGGCEESILFDGTLCGELDDAICVLGTCVARGCGDGYRERGDDLAWPREGCDDGNMADGDTCSSMCEPTQLLVVADPVDSSDHYDVKFVENGRLLVFDGLGNGLLAWVEQHPTGSAGTQIIRATRIDPLGNLLDLEAPLELGQYSGTSFVSHPSAAGLTAGGFVVTWAQRVDLAFRVVFRIVRPDGVMGSMRTADTTSGRGQSRPRVAALTDSFVVVWEDNNNSVWGKRFRTTGTALTSQMHLSTRAVEEQQQPDVAAHGDEWMVTFISRLAFGDPYRIQARRFLASGPSGREFTILPSNAMSHGLTALGEDYLLAYSSSDVESRGDLYARVVPRSASGTLGDVIPIDTTAGRSANQPQVAAYGPRELNGFVVAYGGSPNYVFIGVDPASELSLYGGYTTGGSGPTVIGAAPYSLTGGAVWFAYTHQTSTTGAIGASLFQLPPP